MNRIVKILMERDDIDQEIAESLVRKTRDEILSLDEANVLKPMKLFMNILVLNLIIFLIF